MLSSRFNQPGTPQVHPDRSIETSMSPTTLERGGRENSGLDLQKELKKYSNAINAILVGAAVIVGVAFQGFLTPPTDPAFVLDFCIYNSLAFYSSVATMIAGAGAALPSSGPPNIEEEVKAARWWVRASSVLLAVSIVSILGAVPGPHYGNPPNLSRNRTVTVMHCVGLFMCAAPMTAYVVRLGWTFVNNLSGDTVQKAKTEDAAEQQARRTCKKPISSRRIVILVGLCFLIYALFLVFLFFLPFFAKFKNLWGADAPIGSSGN